jgi:hypothetical protein
VKIPVPVDTEMLERTKHFLPGNDNLSAILNEALRAQVHRYEMLAVLDELDRENPICHTGEIAGEQVRQRIPSSSIPASSARLRTTKKSSGARSVKR